jgi:hypothetical protein
MNSKAYFFAFTAILAVIAMLGFSSAAVTVQTLGVSNVAVSFNDVSLTGTPSVATIAGLTGDTVPVRVSFTSNVNASDVRVRVSMEGFSNDVDATTRRINLVAGSTYSELLSLQLPSDLKDVTKSATLYVRVSDSEDAYEQTFSVKLQRESYDFNVLAIDTPSSVSAGANVPVSVVIQNAGMEDLENGFVIVSIPSLGISSKAYFGDLSPVDCSDDECDRQDAVQKVVYLKIPETAKAGTYQIEAKVYNQDVVTTAVKSIDVGSSASTDVISTASNSDIRLGETKTFDLIVVNSGDSIKVFNVQTVSGSALSVSAPSVITVGPQSSATVPVTVTTTKNAEVGSYTFSVVIDGKQTSMAVNVVGGNAVSNSVVILTVILAVIFVILLVVLIVLLVRREKPANEVETSYY